MLIWLAALLLQDDTRALAKKAFGNVRGPRIVAEIRLEREGKEEDGFSCERWDASQKAGVWHKSYFKSSRKGGNSIEWYESNDAQKDPRRAVYLRNGDAWVKQKPAFGQRTEDRNAAYDESQAVRSRMPELAKIKLDTLDAADETWAKIATAKKDGKVRITFPEVDAHIGNMVELFYEENDEVHDFVIERSKASVALEIDAASGKLLGATCVTHYASRDGKKNFTLRYSAQFLELDPKLKLPE